MAAKKRKESSKLESESHSLSLSGPALFLCASVTSSATTTTAAAFDYNNRQQQIMGFRRAGRGEKAKAEMNMPKLRSRTRQLE